MISVNFNNSKTFIFFAYKYTQIQETSILMYCNPGTQFLTVKAINSKTFIYLLIYLFPLL